MSRTAMGSFTKFSYRRLGPEGGFDDYDEKRDGLVARSRNWFRFKRVPSRRRFKLKVPSLRRFLRRKVRLLSAVRVSWAGLVKRLKEGQAHFGDLFAGNYVFIQVNPTSLKCLKKDHYLDGFASRYSLPRVA